MTASNGKAVDEAAAGTPPGGERDAPVFGRYPLIALNYNADASRLVLQYRDPETGKTVSQIPSETALRQYEAAQKERKRAQRLQLVVGGEDALGREGAAPGSITPGSNPFEAPPFGSTTSASSRISGRSDASATSAAAGGAGGFDRRAAAGGGTAVPSGAISAVRGASAGVNMVV